jgi:hypothetical protein
VLAFFFFLVQHRSDSVTKPTDVVQPMTVPGVFSVLAVALILASFGVNDSGRRIISRAEAEARVSAPTAYAIDRGISRVVLATVMMVVGLVSLVWLNS